MCFVLLLLSSGYDALPALQGLLKLNSLISGISWDKAVHQGRSFKGEIRQELIITFCSGSCSFCLKHISKVKNMSVVCISTCDTDVSTAAFGRWMLLTHSTHHSDMIPAPAGLVPVLFGTGSIDVYSSVWIWFLQACHYCHPVAVAVSQEKPHFPTVNLLYSQQIF